jgi:exo-1,4-beta-D-glucosaminidase
MKRLFVFTFSALILLSAGCLAQKADDGRIILHDNWAIQSSGVTSDNGRTISSREYNADTWYRATMPSTVLAALVADKVYPDPYYGTNILNLPGAIKSRNRAMPPDSPYLVPWWYRTVFKIPSGFKGKHTWLKFHSINYKANVWLNGKLIADTTTIEGAYRLFNLDITDAALPGKDNCLALEIFPPKGMDLTITWVDWNPTSPDRGMGIWYDVVLESTGDVTIEHPYVVTKLNLPKTDQARLTVTAEVHNVADRPLTGKLTGTIENITFSSDVSLAAGETKMVSFAPEDYHQLVIDNPRLWWPHTVGPQNLYDLKLSFESGGKVTDSRKVRFGIREITSWMNNFDKYHTRVFQINGKNIVIRGGGYVQDLMLRPSHERIDADIAYAKQMNLNALRMEAPRGSDYLFEKCDEEGILLMVGWCCCSSWERWKNWTPHIADVAEASWKDQIVHLRNHPSVFTWLYGSDHYPPPEVESRYIKVLDQYDNTRPYESSATREASKIAGLTGVWMGPYPTVYAYFPPSYWYSKLEFNTEAGPGGEQLPPMETMRMMMPEKDLWPISESWEIRLHKAFYPIARKALESRYGKPASVEEYSMKSQVFQNEAVKAMFEAYAANKYRSSGIIYWMYNSAWPKLYWQFFDYFFNPNGAFYGARTACEPLHVQYCYNDSVIKIVNSYYKGFNGLSVSAKLYDFSMNQIGSQEKTADAGPDSSVPVFKLNIPGNTTNVYFLKLNMNDASGKQVSSNFYWLSAKGDQDADFTELDELPLTEIKVKASAIEKDGDKYHLTVTLENPGKELAFAVNPKVLKKNTLEPVLPIFWEDNYVSLLPGEKKEINVSFDKKYLGDDDPYLKVEGWNIKTVEMNLKY